MDEDRSYPVGEKWLQYRPAGTFRPWSSRDAINWKHLVAFE